VVGKRVYKRRFNFLISHELDRALTTLKERDGTPPSETVRRALTDYLRRKGVLKKTTKGKG
jgi:hypothetical protein